MASRKKELALQPIQKARNKEMGAAGSDLKCLEALPATTPWAKKQQGRQGERTWPQHYQMVISNQELWEEMLCSKGLIVVDVYQGWCGPCKTVVNLFRKIRNELGDDLLHFAVAEVDSIDALEKYRGKCEPTFLFYAGGELVAVVRGANSPLLQKTILEQLEAERKVLDHGTDRVVIQDEAFPKEEESSAVGEEEEEEEEEEGGEDE